MIRPPGQLTEGIFQEVLGKSIPSLLKNKPSAPVPASDVATALNRHAAMEAGGYSPMGVSNVTTGPVTPFRAETVNASPYKLTPGNVDKGVSSGGIYREENFPHGMVPRGNPMGGSEEVLRKQRMRDGGSAVHPPGTIPQNELELIASRGGLSVEKMEQLLDPTVITNPTAGKLAPQGTFSSLENLDQEAVAYQSGLRSEEMKNRAQSIADIVGSRSRAQVRDVTGANARISKADQNLQAYQNMKAEANELDPNQLLGGGDLLPSSPSATHQQLLNEIDNEIIGGVKELYGATAAKGNILNTELNLLHGSGDPLLAQIKPNRGSAYQGAGSAETLQPYMNTNYSFNSSAMPEVNQNPTIFNFDAQLPGINHVSGEKMPSRLGRLLEDPKGYDEVAHNATNANVVEEVAGVTNPDKGLFGIYDPTKDPTKVGGIFGTMAGTSASGVLGSIGVGATVGGVGAYMTGGEFSEGAAAGGIMGLGLRGISGAINANAMGIQRGMYKNILGDAYDPKMNQEAMSNALRGVDKESLNIGQKGMYSVLANPNKSSVGFSLRAQTLTGGFLAGSMFSSRRSDKRRGFNAHRGNRI